MPSEHDLTKPDGSRHWDNILRKARNRSFMGGKPFMIEVRKLLKWIEATEAAKRRWKAIQATLRKK